jgi:hypothetical protein
MRQRYNSAPAAHLRALQRFRHSDTISPRFAGIRAPGAGLMHNPPEYRERE